MTDEATHIDDATLSEDESLLEWATEQADVDLVEQAFLLAETEEP